VIGTVGPVWPQTEIRVIDVHDGSILYPPRKGVKGELHVKGPQVMKGYYKNPEATQKVLKDGWMNTGDLVIYTYNNCLKLVGRTKETIVLLGGENVEPAPIENTLVESPLIDQVMVVGQDRKFLCALIVPSAEAFKSDLATLTEDLEARKKVLAEVKKLISSEYGFKAFEKIQDIRLLPKAFEVGDELTSSLKMKRHRIMEVYQHLLTDLYSD
jgi:long-chain acyl-CoA synthetase